MESGISSLCAGCLCASRALCQVASSPYEGFFKQLFDGESWSAAEAGAFRVCWECSALARRFSRFRDQVRSSCATLRDYLKRVKESPDEQETLVISKPPLLQICSTEKTDYVTAPSAALEIEEVKQEIDSYDVSDVELKKDESESPDPPVDLDELKSEIDESNDTLEVRVKKKKKLKRKRGREADTKFARKIERLKKKHLKIAKSSEVDSVEIEDLDNNATTKLGKERIRRSVTLDPAKIKKIVLTSEELLLERADDARSEAYQKLPHKCETCIQGFDHEETLHDHMGRKHNAGLGKYQCETCKSVLSSLASYSTHCRRHLLRFECAACGKRTVDKGAMVKHYGSEHEARVSRYTCRTCGAVSESYRAHRYHREKHQEKPQCEDCGKTFTNKNSLRCHILNMHRAGRTYPCQHCDKTYRGKSGLMMHMTSHDAGARALAYCAPCRTHFKTPYNYRHHVRTSTKHRSEDDLRFVCEECKARFLTQRKLLEHVSWDHRNTSDHQCTQCNKRFKHRVGLERHRKFVHEKQRPPRNKMCHHCGRGFTTASILRAHIRTHTGERPLACGACPATFSHSAALYTHNKLVHLKAKPPATRDAGLVGG